MFPITKRQEFLLSLFTPPLPGRLEPQPKP